MPSLNHYRQQKVGKNFETAIRNSAMLRTTLAKKLGVHQSSFGYWYKRGVTPRYAYQVADLLNLDVNDIMSTQKRKSRKHTKTVDRMIKSTGKEFDLAMDVFEIRPDKGFPITNIQSVTDPEPRTVNIELLTMVANMRLSAQQETALLSVALTFLSEES